MSFLLIITSLLDNNLLFFIPSLIILIYNIYSRIKKVHIFQLLIDDRKKNVENANRVGLLYKIKFILYTLVTMCSVSILIIKCFGDFDFKREFSLLFL